MCEMERELGESILGAVWLTGLMTCIPYRRLFYFMSLHSRLLFFFLVRARGKGDGDDLAMHGL